MAGKSPSRSKILNDTLDLMTLMTHADFFVPAFHHAYPTCDMIQKIIVVFFCRIRILFKEYPYLCGQKMYIIDIWQKYLR
jgi:hypothetical protein